MAYKDLSGQRFGRWTVVQSAGTRKMSNGRNRHLWNCLCDCGTERVVEEPSLTSGRSKSCGCYHSDIMHDVGKVNTTHGMSNSRLYRIWRHIINRCNNPSDSSYSNYGQRGITVCDEWLSFDSFMNWALNNGYEDGLSIDRIDTDESYTPDNCRWADDKTQANNRRSTKVYTIGQESHSIMEWSEIYNVPYKRTWKRLSKGMDILSALKS